MYTKNYGQGGQWLLGNIVKQLGTTMSEVRLEDGWKVRKHADQLRSRIMAESTPPVVEAEIDDTYDARIPRQNETEPSVNPDNTPPPDSELSTSDNVMSDDSATQDTSDTHDTPHNKSEGGTVVEQDLSSTT